MSRIGKQPIVLPEKTTMTIEQGKVEVKGPKGTLFKPVPAGVIVEVKDGAIHVQPIDAKDTFGQAMWGTARALLANLVKGVNEGFSKTLEIQGVGYKVSMKGKDIVHLDVGFSHPVEVKLPQGIEAKTEGLKISISGIDKELVGQVAAKIRKIRKPEPYKGKGIRYEDEHVRRKAGKVVKGAE